nr:EAL domain-containing protein [uncultured Lichenicoccus sp.]
MTSFAQDKAGDILIGTEGGVYEYDGTRVTPYVAPGLPSATWIRQIAFDARDRLWVVTAEGVFVRDGTTFRALNTGRSALDDGFNHLLALSDDSAVLDAEGVLLSIPFGPSGIGIPSPLFDAGMSGKIPGLAKARFVATDGSGGLLIGCGRNLCISSHHRVTTLGQKDGLPDEDWFMALDAPDGVLWVRSLAHLAWRKPGQTDFHVVEVPGHSGSYFSGHPGQLDLVADGRGGVLTEGDGDLLEFDGLSWKEFGHHIGGLPANTVHGLFIDREGSLWAGSEGGGAFRSQGLGIWEHWTADDGLPSNTVWSMARLPNGQLWVATDRGTVAIGDRPGRVSGSTYAVAATRKGQLWLAPFGGALLRLDAQHQATERMAFAPAVMDARVDHDDGLWLGTREGVFLIRDADAAMSGIHPRLVLPDPKMVVAADPAGRVWAAGLAGIFRFGQDGVPRLVVPPALLGSRPLDLAFAPDGAIWVATEAMGIHRFRMNAGHLLVLPSIRPPTIGSDSILFLHRDRLDRLWVGSDHGIDMFDGRSWRRFDSSQGPITNDLDQTSVYEDIDGSMWFGTSGGLSHFLTPDHLPLRATLHPQVVSVSLGGRNLSLSSRLSVGWSAAPLIIRFADPDYAQGAISFRYRLRGLDNGWSDTVAHEARYAGMPVGKFRFELVAVSGAYGVTSAPVGFTIRISAPWWRRWWFFSSCLAFAALSVFAAWRGRDQLLLKQQRHLEEVVQLRTAEIEHARLELERHSLLEQRRLEGEQRRLEEMVEIRTAEIEQARSELLRIAMSDVLTGLANRRAIMNTLENAVASALRTGEPLAILLCDIDYFKKINDEFGHLAGDEVLIEFGSRLGQVIFQPETAGRYGGEEFLVILPGDRDAILRRALDIQSAASDALYSFAGVRRPVTFSGGVAFLRPEDAPVTVIARADTALYAAKKKGRNCIVFEDALNSEYDETRSDLRDVLVGPGSHDQAKQGPYEVLSETTDVGKVSRSRLSLELDLQAALREEQFHLHYQPIVNVDTDRVVSCEALLRWQSPSLGNVPPVDFIPFAEEVGLMPEIGDWVLRTACQEACTWRHDLKISVNLSPTQFRLPNLVSRIGAALDKTGLLPSRLELELTETAMIDDMAAATKMLRELRALGITIALDDFGTGYSSLSFLRTLPFDRVKIDRSFVQDLGTRPEAFAIVRAVVGLCSSLGAGVTAEGVETDRQVDLLREAGCSEIQGYRIGRPGPTAELNLWMTAFAASRDVSAR